jgi:hypothetical protein
MDIATPLGTDARLMLVCALVVSVSICHVGVVKLADANSSSLNQSVVDDAPLDAVEQQLKRVSWAINVVVNKPLCRASAVSGAKVWPKKLSRPSHTSIAK